MFTAFALLNIVTGVFVTASSKSTSLSREMATEEMVQEMYVYETYLWSMFQEADMSGDGLLDRAEFMALMSDEGNRAFLSGMKLDVNCVERVFDMMDADGSGQLESAAFVETCVSHRGDATALHVRFLQDDILKITRSIKELKDAVQVAIVMNEPNAVELNCVL